MDKKTVEILRKLNNEFYRDHHASFSATRRQPWPGWAICLETLGEALLDDLHGKSLSVFDLACGNLRFEEFLTLTLPDTPITFYAVDNCDTMVPQMPNMEYQSLDVLDILQQGLHINDQLTAPACDLSVMFGFMHHVPSFKYRRQVLLSLIEQTRAGGYAIVSFWQFMNNEVLRAKALETHRRALKDLAPEGLVPRDLDEHDYLLSWENIPGVYRYCHNFSHTEIDRLVLDVADKACVVSRFVADGRSADLNTYLILKAF